MKQKDAKGKVATFEINQFLAKTHTHISESRVEKRKNEIAKFTFYAFLDFDCRQ